MITLGKRKEADLRPQTYRDKDQKIIDDFHNLYRIRKDETWMNTNWMGARIFKCPLDTWVYREVNVGNQA